MKNAKDEKLHDRYAADYDDIAMKSGSHLGEVIFGMCFEYITPGSLLLDIGIGTGLSSILFARAGLEIYGLDESQKMLDVCKRKGFAKELLQYDIAKLPLPYAENTFSVAVCCGVLHELCDLRPIFTEVYKTLKPNGIFALTIASIPSETDDANTPDYADFPTQWGSFFRHSLRYIREIAKQPDYAIQKVQRLLTTNDDTQAGKIPFDVIILQK
jgi:ubiquinone/menaquinone biosynthesis C-methylase UbiE